MPFSGKVYKLKPMLIAVHHSFRKMFLSEKGGQPDRIFSGPLRSRTLEVHKAVLMILKVVKCFYDSNFRERFPVQLPSPQNRSTKSSISNKSAKNREHDRILVSKALRNTRNKCE